jgi:hypothetical protein
VLPRRPKLTPPMPRFLLTSCLLCVLCAAVPARTGEGTATAPPGGAQAGAGQRETLQISVEGTALTGPFSLPQRRGERLLLPVVQIARALGDAVQTDAAARAVRVQRQTGVKADFDAALGVVRENGATVLVLSGTSDIDFPPQAEALMLPVEITAALLGASIHVDTAARVVNVRRGQAHAEPVASVKWDEVSEIFNADYDYSLDQYPTGFNQNLTVRADGRLLDGRFYASAGVSGATGRGLASLNTGTFIFERPNGQRLMAGDIGVANDLVFMSSLVRGVWAQTPAGPARLSAFVGRAPGGLFIEPPPPGDPRPQESPTPDDRASHPSRQTFDTTVAGAYVTFGGSAANPYHSTALQVSSGAMTFDGPSRSGRMLTGGLRASSARYALRADFGVGTFSGLQADGVEADGAGAAADVSGSFNLRDDLSVQGHYTFNSKNFMAAQAGAAASLNLRSLGVTWSPRRWLTASLTDTASSRPNRPDSDERFTTATLNLTPSRYLSSLFVSHTEYRTALSGGGSYTLLSATKNLSRWSLFANASRIKNSGDTYQHAQLGARLRLREADSLQLSQTFGGNGTLAGTVDWLTPSLVAKRVSLGAGFGYSRSASSPFSVYERLNASVQLPFRQTLQITYGHLQTGTQLHVSLRGPLFFRSRAHPEAGSSAAELKRYGSVSGRVYQDLNFNGRYDAGVDLPQANVRVRVDGNLSVETDKSGAYRIDSAQAGEHTVALDLLSVRADLTILGEESRAVTLTGGFNTVVDFRTARTGRVAGAVWLDANGNGLQEADERVLADVRVVTSTGRDTLTDESGQFVVADLAPGLHVLVVDIKTLPDDSVVRAFVADGSRPVEARRADAKDAGQGHAAGSLQVTVVAGAETGNIRFAVSPKPPERKLF